ncbi:MAG: ZIP family metal transporter [Candidatus Saccharimonadaceae bacterium]
MNLLGYIIVFSLIGGVLSLSLAALLLVNKKIAAKFAEYGMPFAAGALLAAVFLDLLPEGANQGDTQMLFLSALIGIVLFFLAERFIRWFHHHHQHDNKSDPAIPLLIIGDTVHNTLDGIAIAAAFLISIPTGIITTLAVAAHEIPQEIGEFGALLGKGMPRAKVLLFNVLSALAATVAAILTYYLGQTSTLSMGVIFGLSAGFLLYVALSDIIPSLHEHNDTKKLFDWQPLLLIAGVLLVGIMSLLIHN